MKIKLIRPEQTIELLVPGDLTSTSIEDVKPVWAELDQLNIGKDFSYLVVDLGGAKMVDSAGLNFLVSLHKRMSRDSGEVHLKTNDKNILRTFKFSRVDQYMKIIQ